MPSRTCWECGNGYTTDTYWDHFTECDADGCGEAYCASTYAVCNYCNGHGFDAYMDEEYDSETGIYSYDYKPEPMFLGTGDYFLGFELEISASNFDTSPISRWCQNIGVPGMLYCKEDGSVDGFEIVSHPMTPEFFDSLDWPGFFAMLEQHYPMGHRNEPEGHGLHVHVSRTAFPHKSTLARWSYLLNTQRDHVNRVARRAYSNWARFTDYPVRLLLPYERDRRNRWYEDGPALPCGCCYERVLVEETLGSRLTRQFQTVGYPERYQAVNLTNHSTVEVRVFRSTRVPDEFVSSVHFVAATVDFVRTMQPWHATREATSWDRFAEYIAAHPVFAKETNLFTGRSISQPVTV